MDYAVPERRKNRNDKRAKARFNRFKHGGSQRSAQHDMNSSQQQDKQR